MARFWGPRSTKVRSELCPELQEVADFILNEVCDVSLICGHRSEEEQNALYPRFTKVKWPNSKHNKLPAEGVDLQPFPYPESDQLLREQLSYIAGRAIQYAQSRHIHLRWGGDWDRDGDLSDNNFDDLFHFEVYRVPNSIADPAPV